MKTAAGLLCAIMLINTMGCATHTRSMQRRTVQKAPQGTLVVRPAPPKQRIPAMRQFPVDPSQNADVFWMEREVTLKDSNGESFITRGLFACYRSATPKAPTCFLANLKGDTQDLTWPNLTMQEAIVTPPQRARSTAPIAAASVEPQAPESNTKHIILAGAAIVFGGLLILVVSQ